MTIRTVTRALTNQRAATIIVMVAVWWLACIVFVASRSAPVGYSAQWLANRTAWALPVSTKNRNQGSTWPPHDSLQFGYGYPFSDMSKPNEPVLERFGRLLSYTKPWVILDGYLRGLLLPLHATCCFAMVLVLSRIGFPRPLSCTQTRRLVFWRVFWTGLCYGALWLSIPHFVAAFWFHASIPGAMYPLIDIRPEVLTVPTSGAFLGYLVSIVHVTRSTLWKYAAVPTPSTTSWPKDCLRCGYQAAPDKPCPECGESQPLSIGAIYFGQWHAKLARRRFVDPVRLLIGCVVAILFAWPLVAGLFLK